jgi:hypothetical protein
LGLGNGEGMRGCRRIGEERRWEEGRRRIAGEERDR